MQSWSLERFIEAYDIKKAAEVMNMTRQAVELAVKVKRAIYITLTADGYLESHESKVLSKTAADFDWL